MANAPIKVKSTLTGTTTTLTRWRATPDGWIDGFGMFFSDKIYQVVEDPREVWLDTRRLITTE